MEKKAKSPRTADHRMSLADHDGQPQPESLHALVVRVLRYHGNNCRRKNQIVRGLSAVVVRSPGRPEKRLKKGATN